MATPNIPGSGRWYIKLLKNGYIFLAFGFCMLEIFVQWESFNRCQKDVATWMIGSHVSMLSFRVVSLIGESHCCLSAEIWHVRQPRRRQRVIAWLIWLVCFPPFLYWTIEGTLFLMPILWHHRLEECLPTGTLPMYVVAYQGVSYLWVLFFVLNLREVIVLELRLRRAETALRSIETADTLQRWGRQSFMEDFRTGNSSVSPTSAGGWDPTGFITSGLAHGVPPEKLSSLPVWTIESESDRVVLSDVDCAICITGYCVGDSVRRLPHCNHSFHQACIDLWLLRSASCPLCKSEVRPDKVGV